MPQQVFVVHGGEAFNSYADFLENLEAREMHWEPVRIQRWKETLGKHLGEDFHVHAPHMPNAQNAKYAEWKIWFKKYIPYMEPGLMLVGHSLGGIFLVRFLSEEQLPVSVRATFLVAAPYNTKSNHPLADFVLSEDLGSFSAQAGEVFIYHSKDDTVVPYTNATAYVRAIPRAHLRTFTDRGHFRDERFVELEEDIQSFHT